MKKLTIYLNALQTEHLLSNRSDFLKLQKDLYYEVVGVDYISFKLREKDPSIVVFLEGTPDPLKLRSAFESFINKHSRI